MKAQTFQLNTFIGKQFLALAKKFCNNFQYNKICSAEIDCENYAFFSDGNTITISSVNVEKTKMIEYLVDISPYTKEELVDYTLEELQSLANHYFVP